MRIVISLRALRIGLLLVGLVGGGALLVDRLIETDAERIEGLFDAASRAAERHDVDTLVDKCLDEEFVLGHLDREGTRAWARDVLSAFQVTSIKKYSTQVTVDGDRAQATVRTFVRGGRIPGDRRLDWEVELRRTPEDRWKIRRVQAFYFLGRQRQRLNLIEAARYAESL